MADYPGNGGEASDVFVKGPAGQLFNGSCRENRSSSLAHALYEEKCLGILVFLNPIPGASN